MLSNYVSKLLKHGFFYRQGKRKSIDRLKVNGVYYALDVLKDRVNTREKKWHDSLKCLETNIFLGLMMWYLALPLVLLWQYTETLMW